MNKKTIESYIALFKASGLSSLSIKTADFEISMSASSGAFKPVEEVKTVTPAPKPSSQDIVKAPIVGIFYTSPGPGEAPFVRAGQKIKKGDPIGIIEAMKVMNEIVATKDGIVQTIFVKDKDYVEYNQPLIEIV